MKILVLNLGSTSTKLGVFEDTHLLLSHTLRHSREALAAFAGILDQRAFRQQALVAWLSENNHGMDSFDVIAARGGLLGPLPGGSFLINQAAADRAASGRHGMHAANVGMLIAKSLSDQYGIPAYFTDAPSTDEMTDVARVSGFAGIQRESIFHALNMKQVVRRHCEAHGLDPRAHSFIVAHMGGGITVAAIKNLAAVDVNNGVAGEGPFSPERAGSLPARALLRLLEDSGQTPMALYETLYRQGGAQSYFGTNDMLALEERMHQEPQVKLVLDAMLYQVARQIAGMAVPLKGQVAGILLTGGIANSSALMGQLTDLVSFIAPCSVYPGEDELTALAEGAYRCETGQEEAQRIED
ncbi:MAG: butyrate kinase [Clostridiales bacterium]|nr:butyrate kinase [Clostridiales bacterium]